MAQWRKASWALVIWNVFMVLWLVSTLQGRFSCDGETGAARAVCDAGASIGMSLGASLVGAPKVLLLDEPTTGLDPRSRLELWESIRSLVRGGTDVLLTTQYLEEADQLADHIVIVDHGRVIADGAPAAVDHHHEVEHARGHERVLVVVALDQEVPERRLDLARRRVALAPDLLGHVTARATCAARSARPPSAR